MILRTVEWFGQTINIRFFSNNLFYSTVKQIDSFQYNEFFFQTRTSRLFFLFTRIIGNYLHNFSEHFNESRSESWSSRFQIVKMHVRAYKEFVYN